ncbi:MAG TPA: carbonic anhydrase, partial [Coleofasciculaceae cyanobacterium]
PVAKEEGGLFMKKLLQGINQFRSNYVSTHWDLLEQLSHGQAPRVLFITCSDSRIDPNLMTQTEPGELFIIRNAGNIIPPYGSTNGGEGATIEYAIQALGIEQIIVCGHSHCGAMKGLLKLEKLEQDLPLVHDWLKHAEATRRLIKDNYPDRDREDLLEIAIAENVLNQIDNLETYPIVRSRLYQGRLKIYGWIYHIETGEVLAYDPQTHSYLPPQSLVADERNSGASTTSNAPPVACELPPIHAGEAAATPQTAVDSATKAPQPAKPGSRPEPIPAYSGNGGNPDYPAWLSREQAERIYRGSGNR